MTTTTKCDCGAALEGHAACWACGVPAKFVKTSAATTTTTKTSAKKRAATKTSAKKRAATKTSAKKRAAKK